MRMFIYKEWDQFCEKLDKGGINSVTASSLLKGGFEKPFLILKHDVETSLVKALKLAEIEHKYSHKGTYYIQGYLLESKRNIKIMNKIQKLGHEVSYHHDVMDSNKGNIEKAELEFKEYCELFKRNGFDIITVCQHGNPIIERKGYTSNRDFFRNSEIANRYNHVSEIMVNFKSRIKTNFKYVSDAGYGWKIIFDPETNDIINSDDKNISLNDLDELIKVVRSGDSIIVSTHPHRWQKRYIVAYIKDMVFKVIKRIVKLTIKIPIIKKILNRYYFLAKKI